MPWIDLDDVKAHLKKASAGDDAKLVGYIPAACGVIEDLKGHVDVVTCDVTAQSRAVSRVHPAPWCRYPTWVWEIELPETPIFSVDDVERLAPGLPSTQVVAADPAAPLSGWQLDGEQVLVPQPGFYSVTYRAGRNPVPGNFRLAALELVAHLWRGSQLNQEQGRPQPGGDQQEIVPRIASALPYRVRELLGIYGNVVNDHVVIA